MVVVLRPEGKVEEEMGIWCHEEWLVTLRRRSEPDYVGKRP